MRYNLSRHAAGHRDLFDREGGIGQIPALSFGVIKKWKRQLAISVRASLRNSKPLKAPDLRRLEIEKKKLKAVVLTQSLIISELKKEMNWD
jgi:hypothetical protein